MKKIILYSLLIFSTPCFFNGCLHIKKEELNVPLIIDEHFSISYLKIGDLKYSDFNKKNKTAFTEFKSGGLSCGSMNSMWSSVIKLENNEIGLKIEFVSSWIGNTKKKEEILSKIELQKVGGKFYNGVTIGESTKAKTKTIFGKPKQEGDFFLLYKFDTIIVKLFFTEQDILYTIIVEETYH